MRRIAFWICLSLVGCTVTLKRDDDPDTSSTSASSAASTSVGTSQGNGTTSTSGTGGSGGDPMSASSDATSTGGDATSTGGDATSTGGSGPCGALGEACCPGSVCDDDQTPCDAETNTCLGCARSIVSGDAGDVVCVERKDGNTICWGRNSDSLVDCGPSDPKLPRDVSPQIGDNHIESISTHICALDTAGNVECWGANDFGQLGVEADDDPACAQEAQEVSLPSDVAHVRVAVSSSFAVLDDGHVYGWGSNEYGQLGDSVPRDSEPHEVPILLSELDDDVADVATTSESVCARKGNGTVVCMGGSNSAFELGTEDTVEPGGTNTVGVTGVNELVGGSNFYCARSDGVVRCWGSNGYSQLGGAIDEAKSADPQVVDFNSDAIAVQLSAGEESACALLSDDTVVCWGKNFVGNTGSCGNVDQSIPLPVYLDDQKTELLLAKHVELSATGTCAVTTKDQVLCWGGSFYGQIGFGEGADPTCPPGLVSFACE